MVGCRLDVVWVVNLGVSPLYGGDAFGKSIASSLLSGTNH